MFKSKGSILIGAVIIVFIAVAFIYFVQIEKKNQQMPPNPVADSLLNELRTVESGDIMVFNNGDLWVISRPLSVETGSMAAQRAYYSSPADLYKPYLERRIKKIVRYQDAEWKEYALRILRGEPRE
jgi:hypothetical protein